MNEYIVKTTSGQVKGYLRGGIIEYLGIPYAEPPVGPLRFKRSVPKAPWVGVYDAKEYGPVPVQFEKGQEMGSEDCLTGHGVKFCVSEIRQSQGWRRGTEQSGGRSPCPQMVQRDGAVCAPLAA